MRCPECGSCKTKVTSLKWNQSGTRVRRYRKCNECGYTFRTTQTSEKIDNDGRHWNWDQTRTRGETHGMSVFTAADIRRMREMYETGTYTKTRLGEIFGCSRANIRQIVERKTWAHIE